MEPSGQTAPSAATSAGPRPAPAAPARRHRLSPKIALVAVMLIGALVAIFAAARAGARRDPEVSSQIEVLLGLGDTAAAMELAKKRWGADSEEYRVLEARDTERRRAEAEREAAEDVRRHDWEKAETALEHAAAGAAPERRRELLAALELARDFLRAQSYERQGRGSEAIEIYQRAARRVPSMDGYCRAEIERLEKGASARPAPRK